MKGVGAHNNCTLNCRQMSQIPKCNLDLLCYAILLTAQETFFSFSSSYSFTLFVSFNIHPSASTIFFNFCLFSNQEFHFLLDPPPHLCNLRPYSRTTSLSSFQSILFNTRSHISLSLSLFIPFPLSCFFCSHQRAYFL